MKNIKMNRKPFNWIKTKAQKVIDDQQVRSAVKQAVVGLLLGLITEKVLSLKTGKKSNGLLGMTLNVGFNLILPNRYKMVKTVGVLVVGTIILQVKKAKEKKRLAKQESVLIPSPIGS